MVTFKRKYYLPGFRRFWCEFSSWIPITLRHFLNETNSFGSVLCGFTFIFQLRYTNFWPFLEISEAQTTRYLNFIDRSTKIRLSYLNAVISSSNSSWAPYFISVICVVTIRASNFYWFYSKLKRNDLLNIDIYCFIGYNGLMETIVALHNIWHL